VRSCFWTRQASAYRELLPRQEEAYLKCEQARIRWSLIYCNQSFVTTLQNRLCYCDISEASSIFYFHIRQKIISTHRSLSVKVRVHQRLRLRHRLSFIYPAQTAATRHDMECLDAKKCSPTVRDQPASCLQTMWTPTDVYQTFQVQHSQCARTDYAPQDFKNLTQKGSELNLFHLCNLHSCVVN
jgi:hypothetical protein